MPERVVDRDVARGEARLAGHVGDAVAPEPCRAIERRVAVPGGRVAERVGFQELRQLLLEPVAEHHGARDEAGGRRRAVALEEIARWGKERGVDRGDAGISRCARRAEARICDVRSRRVGHDHVEVVTHLAAAVAVVDRDVLAVHADVPRYASVDGERVIDVELRDVGILAPVHEGDVHGARRVDPKAREELVRGGAVVVHLDRRAPGDAVVVRMGEPHVEVAAVAAEVDRRVDDDRLRLRPRRIEAAFVRSPGDLVDGDLRSRIDEPRRPAAAALERERRIEVR